jgi:hypothetical protein
MKISITTIIVFIFCFIGQGQSLLINPISKVGSATIQTLDGRDSTVYTAIEDYRFFFQGTTAINTTEEITSSIQGSQKFIALIRLKPQVPNLLAINDKLAHGFDFTVGMNVLNLKPTGVSSDSLDLVSLMFPEAGNFGLMLSPIWHWYISSSDKKTHHRLSTEVSFSLVQTKVNNLLQKDSMGNEMGTPEDIQFTVLNYNIMPFRYNFIYHPKDDFHVDFSFGMYYNLFNVPNEDATAFNKLYPADSPLFLDGESSLIHGVGFKVSCGINGFLIFADLRQNFGTDRLADSNPFKGFVFNTGIAQNLSLFKR